MSTAACSSVGAGGGATSADGSGAAPVIATTPGNPADGSKPPIAIGFHNLEGGTISLPEVRNGFDAGVRYVNEQLAGINGHPLTSINCQTDGTPESSVNCANQFVEQGAVLAVQGADFGADAMIPVLASANLAEIGPFPLTPGMNAAVGDAYFMQGSAQEGYAATLIQLKELGASRTAVVMVDTPASHQSYDTIIQPAGVRLGVETRVFYVPVQSDWTVQSAAVLAWSPDSIASFVAADALAAVPAFRAAGFSGYITAGSNVEIVAQLDASVLDDVLFVAPYYLPEFTDIPPEVQPDIDAFTAYTAGLPADGSVSQRQTGFYVALLAAQAVRDIGGADTATLTADVVHAGMATWRGDREPFRTNGWDCSAPSWPGTTACGTGNVYAAVGVDGRLTPLPDQPVDITSVRP